MSSTVTTADARRWAQMCQSIPECPEGWHERHPNESDFLQRALRGLLETPYCDDSCDAEVELHLRYIAAKLNHSLPYPMFRFLLDRLADDAEFVYKMLKSRPAPLKWALVAKGWLVVAGEEK